MFTGLVDAVGTVVSVTESSVGRELRIAAPYPDLVLGESVAVNGACLTVRELGGDAHGAWFEVGAVETTLERTTIGRWHQGRQVNLERAVKVGDRFGGHFVLGHVDGVAQVIAVRQQHDARLVDLGLPTGVSALMVPHGSLTVDGVSLTVNALPEPDVVQLSLIDYTLQHTTLGRLAAGDAVHIEADVIGKYVRRLVAPWTDGAAWAGASDAGRHA